ncbi:5536_t:CDS:2 [Paraglomus brasilianum]|uniref:5536_t:CDS:1 n=1 Tax=Paraglomus brasilianum TaxID=144538 RepID=A0A9N9C4D7_9GLOM|nr:5536_t:CDS:2 [Paraglomus brasilianum]
MEFTSNPVTNNEVVESDLEKFAERLGLKEFTENKDEWKKFYVFARSDFVWPPKTGINEHRLIFDYVVDSEYEDEEDMMEQYPGVIMYLLLNVLSGYDNKNKEWQKLYSSKDGWKTTPIEASGYGAGVKVFQASRNWLIRLGDGSNWSNWVTTNEIYTWQVNPTALQTM